MKRLVFVYKFGFEFLRKLIRCTLSMSAEEMSLRRRIQPFWIALTPQRARRNYIKIITIGFKFQINILSTNEQV